MEPHSLIPWLSAKPGKIGFALTVDEFCAIIFCTPDVPLSVLKGDVIC